MDRALPPAPWPTARRLSGRMPPGLLPAIISAAAIPLVFLPGSRMPSSRDRRATIFAASGFCSQNNLKRNFPASRFLSSRSSMDFMSGCRASRDRSTEILLGDDQEVGVIGRNHEDVYAHVSY